MHLVASGGTPERPISAETLTGKLANLPPHCGTLDLWLSAWSRFARAMVGQRSPVRAALLPAGSDWLR